MRIVLNGFWIYPEYGFGLLYDNCNFHVSYHGFNLVLVDGHVPTEKEKLKIQEK